MSVELVRSANLWFRQWSMLSSTAKVAVCIVQGQDARCVVVEQVEQPASLFVEHLPQPVGDGVNLLQPFLYNT